MIRCSPGGWGVARWLFVGLGLCLSEACRTDVGPSLSPVDLRRVCPDSMLLLGQVRLAGVETAGLGGRALPPAVVEIARWQGSAAEFAVVAADPVGRWDDPRLHVRTSIEIGRDGHYRFFNPVIKGPVYAVRVLPLLPGPFVPTYYPHLLGPEAPDTLELALVLRSSLGKQP